MKKLQILFAAALCGSMFTYVPSAAAQTGHQGYGTVVRVVGIASYSLGDNNWHPLVAGKYLPVGAVVRTGENGTVDIVLGKSVSMPQTAGQPDRISFAPDYPVSGLASARPRVEQNVIRLTPNTTVGIDKLTVTDTGADTVSDTELNLKKGKIFASVKKLSGASQYLIRLPNGIAGVRGTKFSITAEGAVAVFDSSSGGVVLSLTMNGTTQTFLVAPGQLIDPITGQIAVISPDMFSVLQAVFSTVATSYYQLIDFSFDHTVVFVSPTHGAPVSEELNP